MATLSEIVGGDATQTRTVFTTDNVVVEPLNGPTSVEEVMDRFPEETYQQGRDTHLFRLLTALCGDSGAGLAKKQAYAARLRYEAEFVEFNILDDVYVSQFRFQRLRPETYVYNVDADALTPTQWDQVQLADQSYYHRVQEWWKAVRYGTSEEAMRLAAQAGSGVDCDVVPHYRFIHDLYSDLPLGLRPEGVTTGCEEFVVIPRFVPGEEQSYQTEFENVWTFTPPVLNGAVSRPVPAPTALETVRTWVPPATRVDTVGSSARAGNAIAIPPHLAGDLILVTAMQFGAQPTAPAAGGTVPAWQPVASALTYSLGVTTVAHVATGAGTTSGVFGGTGYIMVTVLRPTNGTLKIGAVASNVSPPNPGTAFITYPALALQNRDGGSSVYRVGAIRETGDSQIDNAPPGFTFLSQYGVRRGGLEPVPPSVSAAFASHVRAGATEVPADPVRVTWSGGPGSFVATSVEVQMVPSVPVETIEQKRLRYALEEDQALVRQPFARLLPELERNSLQMLDRLRPVTSVVSFKPEDARLDEVQISGVAASSERIHSSRLVTGDATVPWPDPDASRNFFIVGGQEEEPGYFYGSNRDLPTVFLTVESSRGYKGDAAADPTYGTPAFYEDDGGLAPFEHYRSEHRGPFFPVLGAIFPFVLNVLPESAFTADQAVANQNTPLVFEGSALG